MVVDATRLERNLNLVLQVLEITDRVVVCLNLMDEARRHNLFVDERALMKELGVPIVAAAARQKEGMDNLLKYIDEVTTGKFICKPFRTKNKSKNLGRAIDNLSKMIVKEFPGLPNTRWVALRLLEGDQKIIDAIRDDELGKLSRENSGAVESVLVEEN